MSLKKLVIGEVVGIVSMFMLAILGAASGSNLLIAVSLIGLVVLFGLALVSMCRPQHVDYQDYQDD